MPTDPIEGEAPGHSAGTGEYSIKAVAAATGLSVATLRAWERRYAVIEPGRSVCGHRVYTADDVSRLRRLRATTACGHSIGKVAHLSNEELGRLLADSDADQTQCAASTLFVERILRALSDYQPAEVEQSVAMATALLPVPALIRDVLAPALREVGARWHRGEFSIGQERLLSGAVRRHIGGLLATYTAVAKGPLVVFATLSGERHDLGLMMYAALAAAAGLRVDYLGADLPADVVGEHAGRVAAAAVAISIVKAEEPQCVLRQLDVLRRRLAARVDIWLGGAGAYEIEPKTLPRGTFFITTAEDLGFRAAALAAASP